MIEHNIIRAAISDRDTFNKINTHLDYKTLSEYGEAILKVVKEYYLKDNDTSDIDIETVKYRVYKKYKNKTEIFEDYFDMVPDSVSVDNVLEDIVLQKKETLGTKLATILLDTPISDRAIQLMEDYLNTSSIEDEELYNATPIAELLEHISGKNLIPIYPAQLNKRLGGGLPKQSQVLIAARPNIGKTTVAINMSAVACMKGYRVLYGGNEDAAVLMNLRMVSRLTGWTKEEIKELPEEQVYDRAMKNGYGNFYFKDLHPGSIAEIRGYVEQLAPDMVIIDQIRLIGSEKDSMTVRLEKGAIGMRSLAKEFYFVSVLATQAGDSATGKLILSMEDIADSKTGIQGAIDLMIGVGQDNNFKEQSKVMLSFPKYKHGVIKPFACKINYPLNKLKSLKK